MKNKKHVLSALWIFVSLNYIYCDLLGLMDENILSQFLAGNIDGINVDEQFLLSAAVLMEIPMLMVLLSVILPYSYNRWANVAAGIIKTLVMVLSLFVGRNTDYYLFFAAIEVAGTVAIVVYALSWLRDDTVVRPSE